MDPPSNSQFSDKEDLIKAAMAVYKSGNYSYKEVAQRFSIATSTLYYRVTGMNSSCYSRRKKRSNSYHDQEEESDQFTEITNLLLDYGVSKKQLGSSSLPLYQSMPENVRCGDCEGCKAEDCNLCVRCIRNQRDYFRSEHGNPTLCIQRRCVFVTQGILKRYAIYGAFRHGCLQCEGCLTPNCDQCIICMDRIHFQQSNLPKTALCCRKKCPVWQDQEASLERESWKGKPVKRVCRPPVRLDDEPSTTFKSYARKNCPNLPFTQKSLNFKILNPMANNYGMDFAQYKKEKPDTHTQLKKLKSSLKKKMKPIKIKNATKLPIKHQMTKKDKDQKPKKAMLKRQLIMKKMQEKKKTKIVNFKRKPEVPRIDIVEKSSTVYAAPKKAGPKPQQDFIKSIQTPQSGIEQLFCKKLTGKSFSDDVTIYPESNDVTAFKKLLFEAVRTSVAPKKPRRNVPSSQQVLQLFTTLPRIDFVPNAIGIAPMSVQARGNSLKSLQIETVCSAAEATTPSGDAAVCCVGLIVSLDKRVLAEKLGASGTPAPPGAGGQKGTPVPGLVPPPKSFTTNAMLQMKLMQMHQALSK